jgi:hypothetical protein
MSQKTFDLVAGIFFLLIAVGHLLRVLFGWSVNIGGFTVPMWGSWLALVVIGYLAFVGLRASRASS